ncbi:type II toxin-antitoxin system HipA family toxin [uncultured Anaerovibrio sp.]|uniref:type II toxin-antitoxin system HipA family toxin n=1 Tax=uncultured Anaerovibrio sp. TaxID=361586 RepID=UPI002602B38B|nr:type II toxin-antitoxin system HipA family toxin [uncultured Anaerovibrio sp.]
MNRVDKLTVFYHGQPVGDMVLADNRLAAFEYNKNWLLDGFSISPFSLPLEKKVFMPKYDPFEGLFGVFADSLPDGWGRLLVDRLLRKKGMDPARVGVLTRLAIVGEAGMGALSYTPTVLLENVEKNLSYDEISTECKKLLQEEMTDELDFLFAKGGSSGGARPKIMTTIDGEPWLIKFPSTYDRKNIGELEYKYALCAKKCGIQMAATKLFPSSKCSGYFGTKRFDFIEGEGGMVRVHMVSASGLLETSHRIPNLDYDLLMKLTLKLTRDMEECKKLFRLMCFNVFAHNRDDHSKNFTYIYVEPEKRWALSPAYDLTYSNSIGGEHATTVHGEGRDPGMADILEVAKTIGLNGQWARAEAKLIKETVFSELKEYL